MKQISLLLMMAFFASRLLSQSYAGGEISIKHIGNDDYNVWVTYVKNCTSCNDTTGCDLPSKVVLTYKGGKKELSLQRASRIPELPPACSECTKCTDQKCPLPYGYTTYRLKAFVNLETERKAGICNVLARVNMNKIDSTITTVDLSKNLYISTEFTICVNNSTPMSNGFGSMNCLGKDKHTNIMSNSLDTNTSGQYLDRISYSLAPILSESDTIGFKSPYDYSNPIKYLGFPNSSLRSPEGFHLDSQNADLFFRPVKEENSLIRVKMVETRNGKVLSTSYKDIRINTFTCPENNRPVISGINCKEPKPEAFKTEAVAGETICFKICTSDFDTDDSTTLDWNNGIPGASFKVINPDDKRESATFCWQPTDAEVSKFPYSFVAVAQDKSCSESGASARSFQIFVKRRVGFDHHMKPNGCGRALLIVEETNEIEVKQWLVGYNGRLIVKNHSPSDSFFLEHLDTGWNKYTITAIGSNGSNRVVEDSVFITSADEALSQSGLTASSCLGDTVLIDISTALKPGATIHWLSDGDSRVLKNLGPHQTDASYLVKAEKGLCTDTLVVMVDVAEIAASFTANPKSGSAPLEVYFQSTSGLDADSFFWDFGDFVGVGHFTSDPIVTYRNRGLFDVTLKTMKKGTSCIDSITYYDYINVFPTGLPDLSDDKVSLYPNPARDFFTLSNPKGVSVKVEVFNAQGKVVAKAHSSNEAFKIDISHLSPGTYLARIDADGQLSEIVLVVR